MYNVLTDLNCNRIYLCLIYLSIVIAVVVKDANVRIINLHLLLFGLFPDAIYSPFQVLIRARRKLQNMHPFREQDSQIRGRLLDDRQDQDGNIVQSNLFISICSEDRNSSGCTNDYTCCYICINTGITGKHSDSGEYKSITISKWIDKSVFR
ncbi:uncharacterized protein V1516DRAFT_668877 [Lipomyces oligophaga]|uniref:uncharacterized protein n=1 Tax=Lipomyces oligophaga TaxID=45792 RepID=UPI0034CDB8F3